MCACPSRRLLADTLTFGLVVMVAAGTYQLLSRGLLATVASHCPAVALSGGSWGVWAAWRATEALGCYVLSLGDALLGLAVLLAAPWLVYRSGLLRWAAFKGFGSSAAGESGSHCGPQGVLSQNMLSPASLPGRSLV